MAYTTNPDTAPQEPDTETNPVRAVTALAVDLSMPDQVHVVDLYLSHRSDRDFVSRGDGATGYVCERSSFSPASIVECKVHWSTMVRPGKWTRVFAFQCNGDQLTINGFKTHVADAELAEAMRWALTDKFIVYAPTR